jgi:RimJ/RimL family protein N-acetyltransferase
MLSTIYITKRLELVNLVDLIQEEYPTNYFSWMNDPIVTKYNSWGLFPYTKRTANEYMKYLETTNDAIAWAVMVHTMDGLIHIGNITLQYINWINRSAEMAIVIGEKDYWNKGYATEALTVLYNHGFHKLNLHRIWSGTAQTNIGMIKTFEKLGMAHEGTFMDAMFLDGVYTDIVEYAILEDCWNR